MAGFVFREALPDDKEAVLGIREDVYDGRDYLHWYYDEFQWLPNVTSYVCEHNGIVVGFTSQFVQDNGETAVDKAARVRPDYEGRGVYKFLLNEIDKLHASQGRVKRRVFVTTKRLNKPNMKKCAEIEVYVFQFTLEPDTNTSQIDKKENNVALSQEFPKAVLAPPFANYLFPQNIIIIYWHPYRLLETNISLIRDVTFGSTLQQTTDGAVNGLLSAFLCIRGCRENTTVCSLDVFGTNFENLEDHVSVYFKQLREKGECGLVSMYVTCEPFDGKTETLTNILRKLGAKDIVQIVFDHVCVYENSL